MRQTPLGDAYHIERALAARQGTIRYPCGCQHCHGFKTQLVQIVEKHHRKFGRDNTLVEHPSCKFCSNFKSIYPSKISFITIFVNLRLSPCSYICNCLKMPKKSQINEYSDFRLIYKLKLIHF